MLRSHSASQTVAIFFSVFAITACVTISTYGDFDPDVEERTTNAYKSITADSTKAAAVLLRKNSASMRPESAEYLHRHFTLSLSIANNHYAEFIKMRGKGRNAFLPAWLRQRNTRLALSASVTPTIHVARSNAAFASAFPSGEIIISDTLLATFDVSDPGYNDALLGILLHELIHVLDGHAADQWTTADGRRHFLANQGMNVAGYVLQFMPFIDLSHDVNLGSSYLSAHELSRLFESAADFGAIRLLAVNGRNPAEYINFLKTINGMSASDSARQEEPFAWLRDRVACIEKLSSTKFADDVDLVLIGNPDKESEFATLQLPTALAGMLEDPAALRKFVAPPEQTADAMLRQTAIELLQKSNFVLCVIRTSFPKAKITDRALQIPAFDAGSFMEFY